MTAAIIVPTKSTGTEIIGLAKAIAALPSVVFRRTPQGAGEPVLVIPGFLTGDGSTLALRTFLRTRGYRPFGWNLGRNHGRVYELLPEVIARLDEIRDQQGETVRLVGWSLGGVLAREAARARPDSVARIVTMGTPVVGGPKYTLARPYYERKGIDVDAIEADVKQRNSVPLETPVTAIYSKNDRVVAWQACIDDNPDNDVSYVEVKTSHLGLGFSPEVFARVAWEMAKD